MNCHIISRLTNLIDVLFLIFNIKLADPAEFLLSEIEL